MEQSRSVKSNVASRFVCCEPAQADGTVPVADGYQVELSESDMSQCSTKMAVSASYMEIVAGMAEWYAAIRIEGAKRVFQKEA